MERASEHSRRSPRDKGQMSTMQASVTVLNVLRDFSDLITFLYIFFLGDPYKCAGARVCQSSVSIRHRG